MSKLPHAAETLRPVTDIEQRPPNYVLASEHLSSNRGSPDSPQTLLPVGWRSHSIGKRGWGPLFRSDLSCHVCRGV